MIQQCENLNLYLNKQNKRTVIGSTLYLIRFPTMSVNEFFSCIEIESSLLPKQDIIQLIHIFHSKITGNLKFSFIEREK